MDRRRLNQRVSSLETTQVGALMATSGMTRYEAESHLAILAGGDVQAVNRDGERVPTPSISLEQAFPNLFGQMSGQRH